MGLKKYHSFVIILLMFLAILVHSGAAFYVFGILYLPLMDEFGWNRASISIAMTIYLLTIGFSSPIIGKLTDIIGAKRVILSGVFIAGLALFFLGRISSLWQFYLLYFIMGLGFSGCGFIPISTVISKWFIKRRGLAIGLTMAGVSVGAFAITLISQYFLTELGWRSTYSFLAIISWVLVIPLNLIFLKNTPQEIGLLPDKGNSTINNPSYSNNQNEIENAEKEWTLNMTLKNPAFWHIGIAFFLIFLSIGSVLQHQVNYLLDMGISKMIAATALGITGGIGGVGKIYFGYLADKKSPRIICTFSFSLQALGILILVFTQTMTHVWIFVIVFGFAMGGQIALQALVVGEFFGLASYGTILGVISLISATGTALGPFIAGLLYTLFNTYFWTFLGCVLASLLALISILTSKHPMKNESN